MNCQAAQDVIVAAAAGGTALGPNAEAHLAGCGECRREMVPVLAAGRALDHLELLEPSPRSTRAMGRKLMRIRLREKLVSTEDWGVAALTACVAVLASILIECALPSATLAAACEAVVSRLLPTSAAYALAGVVYSLVPLGLAAYVQARTRKTDFVGVIHTPGVFAVLLGGYAVLTCGEFRPAFLAGLLAGIVVGGLAGAAAGTWLGRRPVWQ